MKAKRLRKSKAQKEGARLENAILDAHKLNPVSEGLAYHITGPGFEMRTNVASVALVATQAIQEKLGIKTNCSLGSTHLFTGYVPPEPKRKRRAQWTP